VTPERAGTHVAFDAPTADRLLSLGATNVVRASDNLLLGPSHREAAKHAQRRAAWWSSSEDWDRLGSTDVRWEAPVIVWVSASPQQRVNLWRTCCRLRDLGLSHRDVLVVDLERPARRNPDHDPYGCGETVADHSSEVLLARLAGARAWTSTRYRYAAELWVRYTDPDLTRFARTCLRGVPGFPELAAVWSLLSGFFPRRAADGGLRLSNFDELLLHRLSEEWQTAVTVFVRGPEEWERVICCTGDLFVPDRLDQWAVHGAAPAVEWAAGPKPETRMLSRVYRVTETGRRIREAGIEGVEGGPPLPVAGAEAYGVEAGWIVPAGGVR